MPSPILPLDTVANVERKLDVAVVTTQSFSTGELQIQDWGGEWWSFMFDIAAKKDLAGQAISAFFAQLGGARTAFIFRDPSCRNTASLGSPVVDGASQTGNALVTAGWNASQTVLQAGQFFSIGSDESTRLYQVTADAVSDGTGAATINVTPAIRPLTADAAPLETANPAIALRLSAPVPARVGLGDVHRFSVQAREAI